jgi:hypothetical protein
LSGPHASGVPTRIAEQKRWISNRVERGRSNSGVTADPWAICRLVFATCVSDDSATGPPVCGVTVIEVGAPSPAPSSKNNASISRRRISVPLVPMNIS